MYQLFKWKKWEGVRTGEITSWSELKWRIIAPYSQHIYRRWMNHAGRTLTTMTRVLYPKGDGVASPAEIQAMIARHSEEFAGEEGQR